MGAGLFVCAQVTSPHPTDRIESEQPTRAGALWFAFRAMCFRARRLLQNLGGSAPRRLVPQPMAEDATVIAEARIPLYKSVNPAEFALQAGKVQNLRLAVRAIHGVRLRAGETFSFWSQVGR